MKDKAEAADNTKRNAEAEAKAEAKSKAETQVISNPNPSRTPQCRSGIAQQGKRYMRSHPCPSTGITLGFKQRQVGVGLDLGSGFE